MKGLTPVLKCMLASILLSCLLPASSLYGQKIAVKSNLLYDLTTTFNIGGEIRCDDTHTLSLSVNYNPWNFGGNKKMKQKGSMKKRKKNNCMFAFGKKLDAFGKK